VFHVWPQFQISVTNENTVRQWTDGLRQMKNLHTLVLRNASIATSIQILNLIPPNIPLRSIEWPKAWSHPRVDPNLFTMPRLQPLRRISYTVSTLNPDRFGTIGLLEVIIQDHSANLEYLHLPLESLNVKSALTWRMPRLRHLVLAGYKEWRQAPLIELLAWLPTLRTLAIHRAVYHGKFQVWPEGYGFDLGRAKLLPELESLTLTNPDCGDQLLSHLSSGLRHLSIMGSRNERDIESRQAPTLMCAEDVIRILQHNELSSLRTLRIHLRTTFSTESADTISSTCPLLESLKIYGTELGVGHRVRQIRFVSTYY
jgi:hypothetical protein